MKITEARFKPAEFTRNVFSVAPEADTGFEELLTPEYWCHVAPKMRAGDRIEAVAEDGAWFLELFVTSAGRNWATVALLRFVELSEQTTPVDAESAFAIVWRGTTRMHTVTRKSDKQVIREGFPTAKNARDWLEGHEAQVEKVKAKG